MTYDPDSFHESDITGSIDARLVDDYVEMEASSADGAVTVRLSLAAAARLGKWLPRRVW